MKAHTTIQSWGLLLLGLLFAFVTGLTILKDVLFDGAAFNLTHVQSVAAMVAAIAAGHFVLPALGQKRWLPAFGLALVFLAATGYIVISAGARNAEVSSAKAQGIQKRNAERESAREVLAKAEADRIAAKTAADLAIKDAAVECASGRGKNCLGKEATRESAKDDLAKAKDTESLERGRLLLLGVDEDVHQGYRSIATILEAINIGTADKTAAVLELGVPFALVLITEMAALVFIAMAIGHVQVPAVASVRPAITSDTSGQSDYPAASEAELANVRAMLMAANDDPSGPDGGSKIVRPERWTRDQVRADLQARIDRGEGFPSQRAMSAMYGVPTSTLSDWFRQWSDEGAEIERTKVGRRKMVG